MRTYLTITLLLWASLASQAQAAAGDLPVVRSSSSATAICSGQCLAKAYWSAPEQATAFILDQAPATAPSFAGHVEFLAAPAPAITTVAVNPASPRAP